MKYIMKMFCLSVLNSKCLLTHLIFHFSLTGHNRKFLVETEDDDPPSPDNPVRKGDLNKALAPLGA